MIKFKKRWMAFWMAVLMVFTLSFPIAVISSDYFDYTTGRLESGTRVRASTFNAIFDKISTGFDLFPDETTLNAYFASIAALAAGSGVTVSADDTTVGVLDGKLLAGEAIDFTVGTPAGNETLTILAEDASATNKGVAELATNDETVTGTDAARVTTPANITAKLAAPGAIGETTPNTIKLSNAGLKVLDTNASHVLSIKPGSDIDADRILTLTTGNANRTITLSGNPALADWFDQAVKTGSSPTFTGLTVGNIQLLKAFRGGKARSTFRWHTDGNKIYIGSGYYYHKGDTTQALNILGEETFILESAGSNALSDDFGADGWHYIYIDDSAVITQDSYVIDADCFLNSTTPPTWDNTEFGWYNGDDLCIFAVYETGGNILEFYHSGDFVSKANKTEDKTVTDITTDWSDEVTFVVPAFVRKVKATFLYGWVNATSTAHWRTEGQTATTGHVIGTVESGLTQKAYLSTDVICSSTLKIDVKDEDVATNTLTVYNDGWYFPNGM